MLTMNMEADSYAISAGLSAFLPKMGSLVSATDCSGKMPSQTLLPLCLPSSNPLLFAWYLDDGTLVGQHDDLVCDFDPLKSLESLVGLRLNASSGVAIKPHWEQTPSILESTRHARGEHPLLL